MPRHAYSTHRKPWAACLIWSKYCKFISLITKIIVIRLFTKIHIGLETTSSCFLNLVLYTARGGPEGGGKHPPSSSSRLRCQGGAAHLYLCLSAGLEMGQATAEGFGAGLASVHRVRCSFQQGLPLLTHGSQPQRKRLP